MADCRIYHATATGFPVNVETGLTHDKPLFPKLIHVAVAGATRIEMYDGLDATGVLKVVSESPAARGSDTRPGANPDMIQFKVAPYLEVTGGPVDIFFYA